MRAVMKPDHTRSTFGTDTDMLVLSKNFSVFSFFNRSQLIQTCILYIV